VALRGRRSAEAAPDLDEVYRAHAGQVGRWAARLAGPALDAEDLVHEVFLTVHRLLPGLREPGKLVPWLYRITANVVRDRRRQERRRWLRTLLFGAEPPPPGPSPADCAERRQDAERVYRILDTLPERQRAVLILFELEGHSGEEVAALLGVPVSTVWVWLHRGRAAFRARLAALPPEAAQGGEAPVPAGLSLPSRSR
jgi:RNA polymerase sigma-70 factor, ECF subfamily